MSSFYPSFYPSTSEWDENIRLLNKIPTMNFEEKRKIIEKLIRCPIPWVRQHVIEVGAATFPPELLVEYIRNGSDDVLRNMGLEMLKLKGNEALNIAISLLSDNDLDVVLQAVLILDFLKDPRALEPLRSLLSHSDPNIVQATIIALGKIGDIRIMPDLIPFLKKDSWLKIAAIQALGYIKCKKAIKYLSPLTSDLLIGPIAVEAIASIGGKAAFKILTKYWLNFRKELGNEPFLSFILHVAEGIGNKIPKIPGLKETLYEVLNSSDPNKIVAARLLLLMGDPTDTPKALGVLQECPELPPKPPRCLYPRLELLKKLLKSKGPLFFWGIHIAKENIKNLDNDYLKLLLNNETAKEHLEFILTFLLSLPKRKEYGLNILKFYLSLPEDSRYKLVPALIRHRKSIILHLDSYSKLDNNTRTILKLLLCSKPEKEMIKYIEALPPDKFLIAINHLIKKVDLLRKISWNKLISRNIEGYIPAICKAASAGLIELVSTLRKILKTQVCAEIIKVLGELRDRNSISILKQIIKKQDLYYKVLAIESIGLIGGPEAREILKKILQDPGQIEERIIYHSLAKCATQDDTDIFRKAALHEDWMIRVISAEVLSRYPSLENKEILIKLASDPVTIVAEKARKFLYV